MRSMAGASTRALALAALALAGCGSEPDPPIGPGPSPGGGDGVALVFADSALQAAVEEAAVAAGTVDAAGLVSLTAKDRGIADLDGIEQLTRLEALDLYGNQIRDLSPLSGLMRLRYLDLGSNRVEEVSALESLKSLQVLLLADNGVTEVSALAGLDSLQSVDLTGNPLSEAARAQAAAFRERGVTVELTEPEPEDSVEVVPPEEPPGEPGPALRRFAVAVLLQPAHQGFLPLRPRGPLPGPGDRGGGQPVPGPDRLPLVRRHRARLPHRLPPAQQRGAGPVAGRDPGGLHLAPGQGPGDLRPGRRRRRPREPDEPPGQGPVSRLVARRRAHRLRLEPQRRRTTWASSSSWTRTAAGWSSSPTSPRPRGPSGPPGPPTARRSPVSRPREAWKGSTRWTWPAERCAFSPRRAGSRRGRPTAPGSPIPSSTRPPTPATSGSWMPTAAAPGS